MVIVLCLLQVRKFIDTQKGKGYQPQEFHPSLEVRAWVAYQRELRRMNLIDFADMLQVCGRPSQGVFCRPVDGSR
jgi:hypothetical protein